MRPEPAIIEPGNVRQRIEAPAVGIAGYVVEGFQLAEHGERGIRAKCPFELGQISDLVAVQVVAEDGSIKSGVAHNVIVPTPGSFQ